MDTSTEAMGRWVTAKAIALYYYNVNGNVWVEDFQAALIVAGMISGRWHEDYAAEQMRKYLAGFQAHFGELDFERQGLQLNLILGRYGAEAEREWYTCSSFVRD